MMTWTLRGLISWVPVNDLTTHMIEGCRGVRRQ
jgi:hypothetical protein